MSLHGTLETFALPDVLALLAATKKSGELRVVGGKTDGRVWFDAGAVVGSEVGRSVTFVDAVFELLRLEEGKFSFDADKAAASPGEPAAIEPVLAEAQARLTEWKSIEAVIPSLEHAVDLVPDVRDPHVMVTGEQWRALVGVAASPSVTGVIERLGIGEFDTCRTLKGLVDAGLVTVAERTVPAPAQAEAPQVEAGDTEKEAAPKKPAKAAVAAQLDPTPPSPEKPKIQALTSTPAASAEALEAPTAGEADELVRQVAAMEAPPEPVAEAPEPAAVAAPAETSAEAPAPAPAATEGEEPINRGLLLKFLSSVRT